MTIVCPVCDNRVFASKDALLQHIKSSSAWHPSCDVCERRFTSQTALDAHMASKHPPTFDCDTCERQYHASFALEDHYRGSSVHPNCIRCGKGFKDQEACNLHLQSSHPKMPCPQCADTLVYEDEWESHFRASSNHPTCMDCRLGLKDDDALIKHRKLSHPPIYFPSPVTSAKIEEVEEPEKLKLDGATRSESEQGQLWSPPSATACSPSSSSSSMALVTVPSSVRLERGRLSEVNRALTPKLRIQPGFLSPLSEACPPFSPPKSGEAQAENVWKQTSHKVGGNLIPQHRTIEAPPGSSTPGSAVTLGSRPSAIQNFGLPASSFSPYSPSGINTTHSNQAKTFAHVVGSSRSSSNTGSYTNSAIFSPSHHAPQFRASSQVGLGRLRGYSVPHSETASTRSSSSISFPTPQHQQQPMRWRTTGSPQSNDTTPTMTKPSVAPDVRTTNSFIYSTPTSSGNSTSSSTLPSTSPGTRAVPVLSPLLGTSIWAHSPASVENTELTGPSPSTTAWSTPDTEALTYSATNSDKSSDMHSPQVTSPVGLESTPIIIPPTSPALKTDDLSSRTSTSRTSTARTRWHENPLHCRECLGEECDDITATICGHVFCYRCIVAAVTKDSCCPVCLAPTLLYCLFRLKLDA